MDVNDKMIYGLGQMQQMANDLQERIAGMMGAIMMIEGLSDMKDETAGNSQSPPPKAQGFKVPRSFVETSELAGEPQSFYVREGTALLEGQRMCLCSDKDMTGTLRLVDTKNSNIWVVDLDEGGNLPASIFEPLFGANESLIASLQSASDELSSLKAEMDRDPVVNLTNGEGCDGDMVRSILFPRFEGVLVYGSLGSDGSEWLVEWDHGDVTKAHVYDLALIKGGDHE